MVKSKSKRQCVEKDEKEVISYATKEEEEEFLNFSDDESNDNESNSDSDEDISDHAPKACDVAMSDADSDGRQIDEEMEEMSVDEEYESDNDSVQPFDRKASKEAGKLYAERNKRTIFVGNITEKVTRKVLHQLFNSKKGAGEGAVETIRIRGAVAPDEAVNAHSKRKAVILKKFADNANQVLCAFVVLRKEEDVEKCLTLNNHILDGKHIRVDRTKGKKMNFIPANCIFVGNLPYSVNEEIVRDSFEKCGEIVNVRLVRNKTDGKVNGIGYVEFTEPQAVDFALKLAGTLQISERTLRIQKWSQSETQKGKRSDPKEKPKPFKPRVIVPSNMRGIELDEFVKSKKRKIMKKVEKKKKFINSKKEKASGSK